MKKSREGGREAGREEEGGEMEEQELS